MDFTAMKKMDAPSLQNEVNSLKKELFNLRLTTLAGQGKDNSQFRKLRVKIAQCLTLINKGGVEVIAKTAATKKVVVKKATTKKSVSKK
jgi:ribosomal protein L29